jgi:hypothetical protein
VPSFQAEFGTSLAEFYEILAAAQLPVPVGDDERSSAVADFVGSLAAAASDAMMPRASHPDAA